LSYPATFDTIGQPFKLLTTVDSTNNYAIGQVHAGLATHGAAFFALEQTAGKGQRGKTWHSMPGENITISIILSPGEAHIDKSFLFSASVALACYDFYKSFGGDQTSIKWPNDIYWRDRKAGGILIENQLGSSSENWKWAVAGIGININQKEFKGISTRPVSLKQITGKNYDVIELSKQLCECLNLRMQNFYSGAYPSILTEYNQALYLNNKTAKLKKGPVLFETTIKGVNQSGKLLTRDAIEREFDFGEVEFIFN
jgi:BirA family biotin operon repressor/biotin-[acetyl-CoA-carboxylase] ligase